MQLAPTPSRSLAGRLSSTSWAVAATYGLAAIGEISYGMEAIPVVLDPGRTLTQSCHFLFLVVATGLALNLPLALIQRVSRSSISSGFVASSVFPFIQLVFYYGAIAGRARRSSKGDTHTSTPPSEPA